MEVTSHDLKMIDEKNIQKIVDHKEENGEKYFKIQWKESWVLESKLCRESLSKHVIPYLSELKNTVVPDNSVLNSVVLSSSQTSAPPLTASMENTFQDKQNESVNLPVIIDHTDGVPTNQNVVEEITVKTESLDIAQKPELEKLEILERKPWYKSDTVKEAVLKFHDKDAKIPQEEIKKAKAQHECYIKQLEMKLKEGKWCKKLEYTGSSYEGLKISSDGLEFDVMFVMQGNGLEVSAIEGRDAYCKLHLLKSIDDKCLYEKFVDDYGMLVPTKMRTKFFGALQAILNELKLNDKITLKAHGPAVQMDVKKKNGSEWYSVDLVPAIEIGDTRYVPKPIGEADAVSEIAWRRSFSKEEKDILTGIDQGNGCRRQVMRIIKALCKKKNESTLTAINSYHLKNVLFHIVHPDYGIKLTWDVADIPERVLDVLGVIESYLQRQNLPQYFIPSVNLFSNINPAKLENVLSRIRTLRTSEKKFMKAMQI